MADDIRLEEVADSALGLLAPGAGYIGSLCLFVAGLATFFPVPLAGQIGYLHGPTGSGILYIICAGLSAYITYTRRFFLLYLSGGLAGVMAGYDILNGTRLGYVTQIALGGGFTSSMGGTPDPVITGMMDNTGFSIPAGWMLLAAGIGILILTPSLARQKPAEKQQAGAARDQVPDTRMKEIDNLINIYERGHITREEFSQLKKEIMERK
jgi:hypothetical protein